MQREGLSHTSQAVTATQLQLYWYYNPALTDLSFITSTPYFKMAHNYFPITFYNLFYRLRYDRSNRLHRGRGRGATNNWYHSSFQGRNNGARGRGFLLQQQHFQEHYHTNHPPQYEHPNEGYHHESFYQYDTNGQENVQAGAKEHSADAHTDGTSGAKDLNAKEHYSYEQYLHEHYGYEESAFNYKVSYPR